MKTLTNSERVGTKLGALKIALLLPLTGFAAGCMPDPCGDGSRLFVSYRNSQPGQPECPATGGDTTESQPGTGTGADTTGDAETGADTRDTADTVADTGDTVASTGDTVADTGDTVADTGDTVAGTGDTVASTGDTVASTDTGGANTGDTVAGTDTGDTVAGTATGDTVAGTDTSGANTGDTVAGTDTGDADTGDSTAGTDGGGDTDTDGGAVCEIGTPAATGPDLLTATSFAVLAGSTVTNTGGTVLEGDLGVSPGTAIVGFPPGVVIGTTHANDAVAGQAQTDLTAAYNDAASRGGAIPLPADISGMVLAPGVYSAATSLQIASADLTLDGGGDPNATWIFQIGSTLVTSSGADVIMTDDGCGRAENVFWQVGSSATIGTATAFVGTIMADQSITATSGSTVEGRLLARVGAVTLDTNHVIVP